MRPSLSLVLLVLASAPPAHAADAVRLDVHPVRLETQAPLHPHPTRAWPTLTVPSKTQVPLSLEPGETLRFRGAVPARSWLAFRCDAESGECRPEDGFAGVVDDETLRAALARLPAWLAPDVVLNLNRMDPEPRAAFAALLAELEDERLIDEVGFLLAHLSPAELTAEGFDPQFLVDNAAAVYAMAERLTYATLVEETGEGDGEEGPWTTLRLRYRDAEGAEVWETLPREQYYWHVVHPRLDAEEAGPIDPALDAVALPPDGVFWRDYFPDPGKYGGLDYRDHRLWNEPDPIAAADLADWGPSARGHVEAVEIDPLLLARAEDGAPVALELRIGKGIVLATTLRIEAAAAAGDATPLDNFVAYGPGNAPFRGHEPVLVLSDGENAPETLRAALTGASLEVEERAPGAFAEVNLEDYGKIIVAEGAPDAVWAALEARLDDLRAWLAADYRVLEIHGATEAAWGALPGGVQRMDETETNAVALGGWPGWWEAMEGAAWVWDGERRTLSGERFLDADASVLDRAGYWVSQNLADNVTERREKWPYPLYPPPYRAQHAEWILNGHYGNCGELQDALTSTSRTALVPIRNVSNSPEDHVWNQFWHAGEWHSFQVSWSDSATEIDNPAVCYEKLHGGGKDISFVYATGGNGRAINVTSDYSETGHATLAFTDADGAPVDGVFVLFATEAYYPDGDEYPLVIGFWDWSDAEGRLEVDFGDAQNVYIRALSPVGNLPPEDGQVGQLVSVEEGVPGATIDIDHAFDTAVADVPPPTTVVERPDEADCAAALDFSARLDGEVLEGRHPYNGFAFSERTANQGSAALAVLTPAAFAAFQAGEDYEALASGSLTNGEAVADALPLQGEEVYVVLSAPGRYVLAPYVELDLTLRTEPAPIAEPVPEDVSSGEADTTESVEIAAAEDAQPGADTSEAPVSEGGGSDCSGAPSGSPRPGALLLLLVGLLATTLRRRRRY